MSICDEAVAGVQVLSPYQPGKPVSTLARELGLDPAKISKLASNENPLGPAPAAIDAMQRLLKEQGRYPDGAGHALRHRLAEHHGVSAEQVTLGNGSNDVLDLIARTFLGPGRSTVLSQHAFAVYAISATAVGARLIEVPAVEYGHDLDAMLAAIMPDTRVLWVANPNNPTGTWRTRDALRAFLENVPSNVVVVLDEAYVEYVDGHQHPDYPDASAWITEAAFPNLVVTRTFSKAYGLAGLRVGYAVSSAEVADLLNRVRQPFNVNALAQAAAVAAFDDEEHLVKSIALNRAGLKQFEQGLIELDLRWIPSVGNFLCVDFARPAQPIFAALLREGVIVRPVGNYGLPNHLRISIGTEAENAHCLRALNTVLHAEVAA
jgi:histidinol-phosphate aminotransferase